MKINKEDIEKVFHLPLLDAARELGMSGTLLKKICRKIGIRRWPYRTLKKMASQSGEHITIVRDHFDLENSSHSLAFKQDKSLDPSDEPQCAFKFIQWSNKLGEKRSIPNDETNENQPDNTFLLGHPSHSLTPPAAEERDDMYTPKLHATPCKLPSIMQVLNTSSREQTEMPLLDLISKPPINTYPFHSSTHIASSNSNSNSNVNNNDINLVEVSFMCVIDGTIMNTNDAACSFLGYSKQEICGLSIQYLLHPVDMQEFNFSLLQLLVGSYPHSDSFIPVRVQRADLSYSTVNLQLSCLRNEKDIGHIAMFKFFAEMPTELHADPQAREVISRLRFSDSVVPMALFELSQLGMRDALTWLLGRVYGNRSFISENTYLQSHLVDAKISFPMHDPMPTLFWSGDGVAMWSNETYDLISGREHQSGGAFVNENLQSLNFIQGTQASVLVELVKLQLPELFDCQTPILPILGSGIKRCTRTFAKRLDTKEFAERARASPTKLNPLPEEIYGYVWQNQLILVERLDTPSLTEEARNLQNEIFHKLQLAQDQRAYLCKGLAKPQQGAEGGSTIFNRHN